MSDRNKDKADPLKVALVVAAIVALVVWAASTVFGISLVKALAWVILVLFAVALAALVLGISPF